MNKNLKNWLRISAVALPLSMISVAAWAGIIPVGFDTTGSATWGPSCGTSCTELNLAGTTTVSGLNGYFGGSAAPDFSFSALLDVTPGLVGSSAVGAAPTGGWQLQDASGDSLFGSVKGLLPGTPGDSAGVGLLGFDITGGTGLFDNISGSGGALADFSWTGSFNDAGLLLVDSSSAPTSNVPEPSTLALFAAALAALGWTFGRRRTAFHPRRASATL